MTEIQRFLRKTRMERDGCLTWVGACNSSGYPVFWASGKVVLAHRYAYEQAVGPIPAGLQIDHRCNRPTCVRSDHLAAVTGRENVLRGNTIAARNAAKRGCPEGHEYHVTPSGRRTCLFCNRARDNARYPRRKEIAA